MAKIDMGFDIGGGGDISMNRVGYYIISPSQTKNITLDMSKEYIFATSEKYNDGNLRTSIILYKNGTLQEITYSYPKITVTSTGISVKATNNNCDIVIAKIDIS